MPAVGIPIEFNVSAIMYKFDTNSPRVISDS